MIDEVEFGHYIKGLATAMKSVQEHNESIRKSTNKIDQYIKFIEEIADNLHNDIHPFLEEQTKKQKGE